MNPRDVSQMTSLAKQMYPGRVKFVQEAFADATSTPYGYIFVDLKQDTPSLLVEDHTLISRQCRRLLKGELKRRRCLEFILVCRLCQAAYELLDWTAPLSRRQQRSMHRFTINLRSCIKIVTRRDDSQLSDVWSREETSSLSSDAQQDEEYKSSKGNTRIHRR